MSSRSPWARVRPCLKKEENEASILVVVVVVVVIGKESKAH